MFKLADAFGLRAVHSATNEEELVSRKTYDREGIHHDSIDMRTLLFIHHLTNFMNDVRLQSEFPNPIKHPVVSIRVSTNKIVRFAKGAILEDVASIVEWT